MALLTISFKLRMVLQNIWRRGVAYILIDTSPLNIFLIVLLPARFHLNCLAVFGRLWALKCQTNEHFKWNVALQSVCTYADTCTCVLKWTRLLVPKKVTSPPALTKQCGVVLDMVDRWHHLVLLSLEEVILKLSLIFTFWDECELIWPLWPPWLYTWCLATENLTDKHKELG